jgi:hypothetical protein
VQAAIKAKGIPADSPLVGEEYLGGPVTQARTIRLLIQSLEDVMRHGAPRLKEDAIRTRGDGQVIVDVFPTTTLEKLMYQGFKRGGLDATRGVTPATVKDTQAGFYKEKNAGRARRPRARRGQRGQHRPARHGPEALRRGPGRACSR